jgi:hypothetical protein
MTSSQIRRFAVMLLVTLTVACGGSDDEDNPIGPSAGDPGITNNTDDFQFNLPNVTNYSTNGGYPWRNTGTTARVTQSSSLTSGTGILMIRDPGGRIVYQRSLTEGGTVTTEAGPTGEWRIDVQPANVSGTINFRVQKN